MSEYGVTLEGITGPREILPESLWTGLTRNGYTAKSWQESQKRAQGNFICSESGVWLPNLEDSEKDLKTTSEFLNKSSLDLVIEEDERDKLVSFSGSIDINGEGCWLIDDQEAPKALASFDTQKKILESSDEMQKLRHCSSANCAYHRHYDLTLGVPSDRRTLIYPNLAHFKHTEEGVLTSWGDLLPDVQSSRQGLKDFQQRCLPFVSREKSVLSAYQIAQIGLLPTTGCWFANNYYMTPTGVEGYENWQYDAYSRLRVPSSIAEEYSYKSYALLGHRVVWLLHGNKLPNPEDEVINHRCGFRPCVNPGHLESISPQQNNLHGQLMSTAVRVMEGSFDLDFGIDQMARYSKQVQSFPGLFRDFWNN